MSTNKKCVGGKRKDGSFINNKNLRDNLIQSNKVCVHMNLLHFIKFSTWRKCFVILDIKFGLMIKLKLQTKSTVP